VNRPRPAAVAMVTSAALSHTDDIALRQKRYVIMQSARIVCVVLAGALPVALAWKGLFLVGAVALPWFGVVMANAGPTVDRRSRPSAMVGEVETEQPVRLALDRSRVIDG
jgi:hypothetical protein